MTVKQKASRTMKVFRSFVCLALVCCIVLSCAMTALAQEDNCTIKAGESKRGKGSEVKQDQQAEAYAMRKSITGGGSIKCYIWRLNPGAQVTDDHTLASDGEYTVKYKNSGNKQKGDSYRIVWKKNGQSINAAITVSYIFWP